MLAQDYIAYPGENQYIGYIQANYPRLFPDLITQSQYNRRARNLRLLVEEMRRYWLKELGLLTQVDLLLDTKPIPLMGYKRSKKKPSGILAIASTLKNGPINLNKIQSLLTVGSIAFVTLNFCAKIRGVHSSRENETPMILRKNRGGAL